jgi:tRNA(Ile2) C34 agmatinyltransferase TiaS
VDALMTYEIACMSCGTSLYSGFDLRSPGDVLKALDYRCKKCGTKLSTDKFRIDVKKIDGSYS